MRALGLRGTAVLTCALALAQVAAAHDWNHHDHHASSGCVSCGHDCASPASSRSTPAARRQILEGTVSEVTYLPGTDAAAAMVEVRIQSGKTVSLVRLGPSAYLNQAGIRVKEGESIAVTGFPVSSVDGEITVAFEIRQGSRTLTVRDPRGRPAW